MAKAPSGSERNARPVRPHSTGASTPRAPKTQSNPSKQAGPPKQSGQVGQPRPAVARRNAPPPASGIARFRKQHPMMAALVPVALVVLAGGILVVVKATGGSAGTAAASKVAAGSSTATTAGTSALPAGVLADVTSVSPTRCPRSGSPVRPRPRWQRAPRQG